MKVQERIAALLCAIGNCASSGNQKWKMRHEAELLEVVRKYLPSGDGIDIAPRIDLDASGESRLVFSFGFHHMDEHGFYDGWTYHTLVAEPTFCGTSIRIEGDELSQLDHLVEVFRCALEQECGNAGGDI